jgi:hypothetical protein
MCICITTGIDSEEVVGKPGIRVRYTNTFLDNVENDLNNVFFNAQEFARPVKIVFKDGAVLNTKGIFDNEYTTVERGELEYQASMPRVWLQSSKLPQKYFEIEYIEIDGTQYTDVTCEPDGTGVTDITLHHR